MATHRISRSLLHRPPFAAKTLFSSLLSRSFPTPPAAASSSRHFSLFRTLRPLSAVANHGASLSPSVTLRCLSTRATSSSLNDQNPNWSNRPPKETIMLEGCDFEHWLVVMEKPEGDLTRDDIIDSYIKTLAQVVGSEAEARMKIYSVSTKHYFAFGALVSEEVSYKIKELPRVRWVLPDSYLNVREKDYGGEPFINGQAVPYDPKYHEEWVRNNARANERNRRNSDRPRNNDRSRNFDRRRENMRGQDIRSSPPPMPNQGMQNLGPGMGPGGPPPPPQNNYGPPPPQNNYASPPPNNYPPPPPNNYPPPPQNNYPPPPPQNSYPPRNSSPPGSPPNSYMGGQNAGAMPYNRDGMPSNAGWSNNAPGNMQQNFQNHPNNGFQDVPANYQSNYNPNNDGSMPGRNH